LYLGTVAFSIDKPLTMDQAMPTAWNASEIHQRGFAALGQGRYEISHTLLHQHLLAVTYDVFGESTRSARGMGIPCFLLTLILVNWLAQCLYSGAHGRWVGCTAMLLYATNPFVVQHSLLVDQETTLVPATQLAFLIGIIRCRGRYDARALLWLGLLLALGLWAKELPPYIALFALGIYLCFERGVVRALRVVTAVALLGTALFTATWALYCAVTGVPVLSFIEHSIIGKALNPGFHSSSLADAFRMWSTHTGRWVTPALLVGLAAGLARRVTRASQTERGFGSHDLLWIYVFVYWGLTSFHLYQHPRYQVPLYGAAVVLVAEFLVASLSGQRTRTVVVAALIGLAIGLASTLIADDPLLMRGRTYFLFGLAAPLAACAVALAVMRLRPWSRAGASVLLLMFLIAQFTLLGVKQSRPYTTANSWSEYGERGFDKTLAYVQRHIGNSRTVLRKDLGYYLMRDDRSWRERWTYNEILRGLHKPEQAAIAAAVLARKDVSIVVLDRFCNSRAARDLLVRDYYEAEIFGDFRIYRREER
jgi:4-amino-4-deoxy-L-arabinose transferase-like glycosyltransferase